ncbi:MAG: GAF domain-containing protein [Actinomycetota bacterium]|nr:GAF domain-containing protein [Actinomycetota bacterium]
MPYRRVHDPVRLGALLDAVLLIESDLDLPVVIHRFIEAGRKLSSARYGAVGILDASGSRITDFISAGLTKGEVEAIGNPPVGKGVNAIPITTAKPIRLRDLREHAESSGFPDHHPVMRSFLGVPIFVGDAMFGILYLTEKIGADEFSDEDEDIVASLALAAGIAVENARLRAQITDLTLTEDRGRIARDLHDTVVQRLFALGMALQTIIGVIRNPAVLEQVDRTIDEIDDIIRQVRTTIFALGEHPRSDQSIRSEVLSITQDAARSLGFEPHLRFSGPVDTGIARYVADHMTYALREALSNVVRHAHATSVDVSIEVESHVVLTVTDNGCGPPAGGEDRGDGRPYEGSPELRGRGIPNMIERARILGGTCTVSPAGGSCGTKMVWRVPRPEVRAMSPEGQK